MVICSVIVRNLTLTWGMTIMGILLAIGIGIAAGIIDIIPMVLQKLDKYATFSAFVQWVVLGVVITYVQIGGLEGWLKGLIIAVLLTLPILILVAKDDKKSILPILIMTVILGSLVGLAGGFLGL